MGDAMDLRRWRRYGHDRLYVHDAEGEQVGWVDLKTDEVHVEDPALADTVRGAVAAWQEAPEPRVIDTVDSVPEPLAVPDAPWIDLASNAPGAEARQQALEALAAAPVKNTLARVLGMHTSERAWRVGAKGEELVAEQLAKVVTKDPRWRYLHAIPVGRRGSDIDHVVIGPGGVFTVNAKHHPKADIWIGGDTFLVNGARHPYIRNSRHEAARAAKLLSERCGFPVFVQGLVVTVNAKDLKIKTAPKDVQVLYRLQLAKWLLKHGDVMDEERIGAVFDVARRSTTWS